jgi:hypothetical protein
MINLPNDILNYIDQFYNPYKHNYNQIIIEIKSKYIYSYVMKQLLQFNVRNRNGEILYFARDSILICNN